MSFTPDTLATLAARDQGYPLKFSSGRDARFAKLITNALGSTPGQLPGTTTNDAAAAGFVGEMAAQSRARAAASALTTNTPINVTATALTLTPGDWEVLGILGFTFGATTSVTSLIGAVSATSGTLPANTATATPNASGELRMEYSTAANVVVGDMTMTVPAHRLSIATTTTLFLVAQATFTVSTASVFGHIRARRAR